MLTRPFSRVACATRAVRDCEQDNMARLARYPEHARSGSARLKQRSVDVPEHHDLALEGQRQTGGEDSDAVDRVAGARHVSPTLPSTGRLSRGSKQCVTYEYVLPKRRGVLRHTQRAHT